MKEERENMVSGTPFDDVFKTETEKMGHFLIPVIEMMFGIKATLAEREEMERIANERYFVDDDGLKISRKLSDSCFKIAGKYYHVECQSTEDGSILFRLAEYNVRIALDGAEQMSDGYAISIELPSSGLIKLRGFEGQDKFSEMKIIYRFSGQEIVMPVPVMNVQMFSEDDIYNNELYFLIPFYAIRYEKRFRKISDISDPEYVKIYTELKEYYGRLIEACESGIITEDDTRKLAELSKIILSHVTRKLNDELKERMVNLVGGQVLELQEDRWLKRGREEGRLEGSKSLLFSLVKDKVLDVAIASERLGESEAEFIKEMEEYYKSQKG
ncbi:hypothetical protein [Oribacterium sp. C9]|uniref:hypothetical protein n=1 Tax=Oribacterium sp. C9 TaxID=1943579 RepID=UPI0011156619|nr:hypothetical protein [Oribacterium sp. C9]